MKFILLTIILLLTACDQSNMTVSGFHIVGNNSPEIEHAIETGINNALVKARCRGYSNGLYLSRYTVEVVGGEVVNGVPVYRVPCGLYCGTEYDKGGYITVSGQRTGDYHLKLAYVAGRPDLLALAAEYEAEHQILADNDQVLYESTSVHKDGQGHPLIPSCGTGNARVQ